MSDESKAVELLKRGSIIALEKAIRSELPLIDGEVINHHSHGVYGRELRVPAGSVVVGHIHKFTNMNVLLEGEMSVVTEDGVKRVGPGFLVISPPGTKRAAYAHTDCRWLTVHGTHETDVNRIEAEFIVHTTTTNHQQEGRVTALDTGGFVVVWTDLDQSE